jgi:dihydrofolate synthase/folylpolyglutamate synthase
MYQNMGKKAFKKDLTNTIKLLDALGNPHKGIRWIHVAGTNGKGSVSSILASILSANRLKTGLYTSPHLLDYTERIRIDGKPISQEEVIEFVETIKPHCSIIQPSFFEITVAMAFHHFSKNNIDIGVIEVGLGGRLDSTNVIDPLLSIITSIGWDHMDMLGDTIEQIAFEKAGIIKSNIPVVISDEIPQSAKKVISQKALECSSTTHLGFEPPVAWQEALALKGKWQSHNLKTVFGAYQVLKSMIDLKDTRTLSGLRRINALSGIRGRWETIHNSPVTILETGHNEEAILMIVDELENQFPSKKIEFIWGMVGEKDRQNILKHLPKNGTFHLVQPSVIRGLPVEELSVDFKNFNLTHFCYNSIDAAIETATQLANQNDTILFIGGSTFVVADALRYFENQA